MKTKHCEVDIDILGYGCLLETILDRPLLSCETWIGTN